MPHASFAAELDRYGPSRETRRVPSRAEARAYCRNLARTHYENFTVASWLLPAPLRQHFCHVYAYCRWADDLADETSDRQASLELLAWWEAELRYCYLGRGTHPVFVALTETIDEFAIPIEPFLDLLVAFRQDQHVARYESAAELLDYCRHSANPVGRLVLYLGRCHDLERGRLADAVCTGLQLANFCQDVARDWERGRIYLPQDECLAAGYDESQFSGRAFTPAFRRLLAGQVERAEGFLRTGAPLALSVPRELRVDVRLFVDGGLAILEAIRQLDYNVWAARPVVDTRVKLKLLARAWWQSLRKGDPEPQP